MTHEAVVAGMQGTSAAARREAAVWIARMHGPDRTAAVEAGLRQWLAESPEHREAFEVASELWESAARLPERVLPRRMRWEPTPSLLSLPRWAGLTAALTLVLVLGVWYSFWRDPVLTTDVGEERSVTLPDGTRVALNTTTRIVVQYREAIRRVKLERGEALFEVAKQTRRPFVVTSGDHQVTALGTRFVVRREGEQTAVTLMEGRVSVSPARRDGSGESTSIARELRQPAILEPGERLTFAPSGPPKVDRPAGDTAAYWQYGLVMLDHARLEDAVMEMNRYSRTQLAVVGGATETRISGEFRAGASMDFAAAISRAYGLSFRQVSNRIIISSASSPPVP